MIIVLFILYFTTIALVLYPLLKNEKDKPGTERE
jgi:cytochrome c-type biogenesis protein CcmH/NrfG